MTNHVLVSLASAEFRNKDDAKVIEMTLKFAGVLQAQREFSKCVKVLSRLIKSRGNNVQISQVAVGALTQMKDLSPEEEGLVSLSDVILSLLEHNKWSLTLFH